MKKIFLSSLFILFSFFMMSQTVFGLDQAPMFRITATPVDVDDGSSTVTVKLYKSLLTCSNDDNCTVVQDPCTHDETDPSFWPYSDAPQCARCYVQGRPELTAPTELPDPANRKLIWDKRGQNADMSYTITGITSPITETITCENHKNDPDPNMETTHTFTIIPPPTVEISEVGTGAKFKTISQGQLPVIQLSIDGNQIPDPTVCLVTEPNKTPWYIPKYLPGVTPQTLTSFPFKFTTQSSQLPTQTNPYNYSVTCDNSGGGPSGGTDNDSFNLTVTPAVNLIVPGTPTPATPVSLGAYYVKVKNTGNAATDDGVPFNVLFQSATHFDDGGNAMGVKDYVGSPTITNLGAGATSNNIYTANYLLSSEDNFIRACADKNSSASLGVIKETNEGDNCSDWRAKNTLPNLKITDPIVLTGNMVANQAVTISSKIRNYNASTGIGFTVLFQQSTTDPNSTAPLVTYNNHKKNNFIASLFHKIAFAGTGGGQPQGTITDIGTDTVPALATGGNTNPDPSISHTFSANGIYWVRACADKNSAGDGGLVLESNETDNCGLWKEVAVGGNINGVCAPNHYDCASGTSQKKEETQTKWTWECRGAGTGTTDSCEEDKPVPMSGTLTPAVRSCEIASGKDSCNINFSWTVTNPESVPTQVVRSPSSTVVGSGHTGNNVPFKVKYDSETFYLYNNAKLLDSEEVTSSCVSGTSWDGKVCAEPTPMPDLVAGVVSPTVVPKGSSISYLSTIKNQGTDSTGAGFWNVFQVRDGAEVFTYLSPAAKISSALSPGVTRDVSVKHTFQTAGTDNWMRACADKQNGTSTGDISESKEDNNCSDWKNITVVDYEVDGKCGSSIYSCESGTSAEHKHVGDTWTWKCKGFNGGLTVPCQEECGGSTPCPTSHCFNGVKDADETGKDCGGMNCVPCTKIPKYIER